MEKLFVRPWMNNVDGTRVNASRVLDPDAWLRDYVRHQILLDSLVN
jgi:hypothetical protein